MSGKTAMDVSLATTVAVWLGLLFCLVVHECAHGLAALWLGDDTAKVLGRLTLNPLPHIDPFMTVLLPLVLVLSGSPVIFGGARPVPVNPLNFRINRYLGMTLVAAAGPISNILLAVAAAVLLNLPPFAASINPMFSERLAEFLVRMVIVNFVLALFNLLPIPPLDGSKIVAIVLPRDWADWIYSPQAQTVGMILVAVLVFTGYTRFLGPAVLWATEGLIRLVIF
jgi:Zn-dependent protease